MKAYDYGYTDNPSTAKGRLLQLVAMGLLEYGGDDETPEQYWQEALKELPETHCPYDCDRCHDDDCSCRNCRKLWEDSGSEKCMCPNCIGLDWEEQ